MAIFAKNVLNQISGFDNPILAGELVWSHRHQSHALQEPGRQSAYVRGNGVRRAQSAGPRL